MARNFSLGKGDPPKILKMRSDKGEITVEKYLELSKMISAKKKELEFPIWLLIPARSLTIVVQ
ncbi:MAG TPA: hypothetical protein VFY68_08480 [Nitrososphaeraceae archaeon]|nr:hypothetical protein [Nitrososphaeraceae archaeon]